MCVGLRDELSLGIDASGGGVAVEVFGEYAAGVPTGEGNLAVRALLRYADALGICAPGLRLQLRKDIPHGAGLGGGSSDAAMALILASRLFGREGEDALLLRTLAAELGSDCAFFLEGSASIGSGRGEVLQALSERLSTLPVLLFKPPFAIGTADAYRALRPNVDFGQRSNETKLLEALAAGRPVTTALNAFEGPLEEKYPVLRELREGMTSSGALLARLTGSGSVVFGVFANEAARDAAAEALSRRFEGTPIKTWLCGNPER